VRGADVLIALAGIALAMPTVAAAQTRSFLIPAGSLSEAIARFGEQSGLTIGLADARLGSRRTAGINGRFSTRAALELLLAGTGATFEFLNPRIVRIIDAPPKRARRTASLGRIAPPEPRPADTSEIVVTASKQGIPLDRYAGSVDVVDLHPDRNARSASRGTSAIVARLPTVASTSLGPGRDKLFIRGVADSSFNGPTQATVGQYLGDARLTFNAPDPNLNLYDMERVEVLAGPQGTLYGTGALGGIIRLLPNMPDPSRGAGSAAVGLGTTRKGGTSSDAAAMLNIPIVDDRLAIRAVGYRVIDAGYIDDPLRGRSNINRSMSYGGRLDIRYAPGNEWTFDVAGVVQNIASRDGQYTLRGQPDLTRTTLLAQPFDNDYRLAQFRIAKRWNDMELVSSTALVRHDVETRYDATSAPNGAPPRLFDETIGISLISHETRLSGRRRGTDDWVAGISVVHDIEQKRRRLGDPLVPVTITGVRNEVTEAALFGQYTIPITPRLGATIGGRVTYSSIEGQALDSVLPEDIEPKRESVRTSPSLALSWRPAERLLVFMHYQEAARAGGLAVGPTSSPQSVQRFESDTISMIEGGFRFGRSGRDPFAASATLSYSRWSDVQADLVDGTGLPFTVNIGNGRVIGLDTSISWTPISSVQLEFSAFFIHSSLKDPAPAYAAADERDLPNVAESGGRAAVTYHVTLSPSASLVLDGSVRYVGSSQLGIGPPIDVSQGRYLESSVGGRLGLGRIGLSLDVSNLGDVRGNRFAFGNPFGLVARNQITPLRPRSIRIGLDAKF
jgi:outer membrane receptor protein involved in Fe transport